VVEGAIPEAVGPTIFGLPTDTKPLLLTGHVIEVLKRLPSKSVQVCVTSPPYYQLRAYGTSPQVWGGDPACEHEWGPKVPGDTKGGSGTPNGRNTAEMEYGRGEPAGQFCVKSQGKSTEEFVEKNWSRTGLGGGIPAGQAGPRTNDKESAFCGCGAWRGELGLEPSPELFVSHLADVFDELRRVLRDDGTLWLNLGDSYVGGGRGSGIGKDGSESISSRQFWDQNDDGQVPLMRPGNGLKSKDLVGIPWMVAFELRRRGWYLRSDIIWAKLNGMPESVSDRPTRSHEYVFLLSKQARYFYDNESVRSDYARLWNENNGGSLGGSGNTDRFEAAHGHLRGGSKPAMPDHGGANLRTVWSFPTKPYRKAHFATFPETLPERAILLGTSAYGQCAKCGAPWRREIYDEESPTVVRTNWVPSCECGTPETHPQIAIDIFSGSGTSVAVARKNGRRSIGIDLNPAYDELAKERPEVSTHSLDAWCGASS
jgi:DNA modification methylase